MNGVPSFAVSAGSTWNALQPSGNQPSICRPLTGGVVGCVYFEFSVPEPGGGKPIPVRLCGSVYGLPVVVRSATSWQSIHSAPRSCFQADRSAGQVWAAARAGNAVKRTKTKLRFIGAPPGAHKLALPALRRKRLIRLKYARRRERRRCTALTIVHSYVN